jgi:hypothetical protein
VEVAGRDEAVAAVVAGPGKDDDASTLHGAQKIADLLRDAKASIFHELLDRNARFRCLLVEGAGLVGGYELHGGFPPFCGG